MTGRHYHGHLDLRLTGGRWQKTQTPPLYVNLLDRGDHWLALPSDQSGGLRGGDRQAVRISVAGDSHLKWLPPAATLYHPGQDDRAVCQVDNFLAVEAGSRLNFCPKAGIPCAAARIRQRTEIELEPGAEFLYWDLWTTGRQAAGEARAFAALDNQLSVRRAGAVLFQERWRWQPANQLGYQSSLLQDASQWFVGLAQGTAAYHDLSELMAWVRGRGGRTEIGLLADDLWVARFLSPRAFDLVERLAQ